MPERDIRIRIRVQVTNLESLKLLSDTMKQVSVAEKGVTAQATTKTKTMKKQTEAVKKDAAETQKLGGAFKRFTQDMTHNIYKVLEWGVATGIIYGSVRALRQALLDVTDVDYAIAGLTKVMNDAGNRSRKLAGDVQVLASQYGEMGDVLVTATTEWARLQISNMEILEGTTAALLAQAVAEMSVVDATKYLVAELKQFEQPILNAVKLIDQWNELSNTFAVRAIDIAQSAARAGSVMHNTGVEMERLHAFTTALVQSTGRAGTAIGTALRTFGVYAYRIQTVNKLAELTGMAITDLTGAQMGLGDIIGQIATRWGTYTDEQQKAIAQTIAGTRRSNEFLTLMQQYPTVLDALVQSYRSVGSAQKEASIYLNTVRKQLDITRSLMQRFVTEGGLLATMFKNTVSVLNSFIAGMIVLKPAIIAATVALVAFKVAVYATNVGMGYLTATTLAFLVLQHPVAAAITGLAILFAGVTTAIGYYTRKKEQAIDKAKQMAEAALANAKALGAEAERLSTLVSIYENYRKALETGAAEPGMFNQKQMERMADNLNEIGKQIARITGVPFKELELSATGWADSLEVVRNKLGEIGDQAAAANEIQKEYWSGQIEKQRRLLDFYTIFHNKLKELPGELESGSQLLEIMNESIMEAGYEFKNYREYARFAKEIDLVKLAELPLIVKEAAAKLEEFQANLDSLETTAGKLGDVLLPEDISRLFELLDNKLNLIEDSYDHFAAAATFAGKAQADVADLGLQAIDEQIAAVERLHRKYKDVDDITKETGPMINKLYREREQQINKIIQAGWADEEKELNTAFKEQVASIQAGTAAMVRYNQQMDGNVAASQKQIQGYERLMDATRKHIASLKVLGADTEDAEASLRGLSEALAFEKAILMSLYIPLKQYEESIGKINTATSRASILLQARGASESKLARIEVEAAKRRKDLARTDSERKAAEAALQLAIAREQAADITEKYENAIKSINTELQKDVSISQAAGANAVTLAQMQVQAAEKRIEALQGQDEAVLKLAQDELGLARVQLLAANISEKRNRLATEYQATVQMLTMSQEQEIASLDLLGATDEEVTEAQLVHARQVLDLVRRNQKAYSDMADWRLALLDALRSIHAAESALDSTRMDRIRRQVREEYDMLQSRHDRQIDLMDALGSTTREQVEERMKQLGQEFEFVVTNSRLTADQRRDMAQDLYRDLMDMASQYKIDQIQKARDVAEAYVQQFQRIEDQWIATVREMATGSPLEAILRQMDRIFSDWFEKQVRERWGEAVKRLTGWQIGIAGKTPEEIRAEEESRQKMINAMYQGGDYVEQSIKDGADYFGERLKQFFQKPTPAGGDGDTLLGTEKFVQDVENAFSRSVNWLKGAFTAGAVEVGKAIETGGKQAGEQIKSDMQSAQPSGGPAGGGSGWMTAYGLMRGANIPDWTQARGGGWRAGGYGVGAIAGTLIAPGLGTVIGAQVGEEIVSKGQDLWRWIQGEEQRAVRPRTESLREQLSNTISRGQFREAANITYNVQNTLILENFIPDAAQMKRAIPIIKAGLEDYSGNVSVGR